MLKSLDAGLAKVMSKMGISVVDSYRGAHLFDILGLHSSVVERCFVDTPAPLSGIGFAEVERQLRQTWQPVDANVPVSAELAGLWLGAIPQGRCIGAACVAAADREGFAVCRW